MITRSDAFPVLAAAVLAVLLCHGAFAQTQPAAPAPGQPAPFVMPPVPVESPQAKELLKQPVEAPSVPRSARWQSMDVHYLRSNVWHPPLYYRSLQERVSYPDARLRNPLGVAYAGLYELVQFPAQIFLTPALVVIKPLCVWEKTTP